MDEREMMERVRSAEPVADALAKIPAASRDIARIAMQSFSAGFAAGNAAQTAPVTHPTA